MVIRRYLPRLIIWLFALMYLLAAFQASPLGRKARNPENTPGCYAGSDYGEVPAGR